MKMRMIILALSLTIITSALLFVLDAEDVLAIQYTNYTSDKYQIQFQYPSDWLLEEKTNRFEEGNDISISSNNIPDGYIGILFFNDSLEALGTTNLQSAINAAVESLKTDYTNDHRIIESPILFLT
jgi:hypothetical protein